MYHMDNRRRNLQYLCYCLQVARCTAIVVHSRDWGLSRCSRCIGVCLSDSFVAVCLQRPPLVMLQPSVVLIVLMAVSRCRQAVYSHSALVQQQAAVVPLCDSASSCCLVLYARVSHVGPHQVLRVCFLSFPHASLSVWYFVFSHARCTRCCLSELLLEYFQSSIMSCFVCVTGPTADFASVSDRKLTYPGRMQCS